MYSSLGEKHDVPGFRSNITPDNISTIISEWQEMIHGNHFPLAMHFIECDTTSTWSGYNSKYSYFQVLPDLVPLQVIYNS